MGKGPHKYAISEGNKDDKTDTGVEKLKTPRQVVPSLIDVSSCGRLHQLSRNEPATDDRELPLSSTTAHVRLATVVASAARCDVGHVAAVKRAYANINVQKIERVTTLPCRKSL